MVINVIKVGGAVVEDTASLAMLLDQFAALCQCSPSGEAEGGCVLVHGGGRSATKLASQLGIESKMVGGRRITDDEMLRIVSMVYGGLVNKNLVAQLQARGVNALGLTGADMNVMLSHKRPLKKVTMEDGSQQMIDFGWVGDVDKVDGSRLASLINTGVVPVMAPLTHDGEGHLLNTNADTIASQTACGLAQALSSSTTSTTNSPSGVRGAVPSGVRGAMTVTLTYCFEKPGVLSNPDDDSSVIPVITEASYEQLKADGIVSGGMLPKLDNAFDALHRGVSRVIITSANDIAGEHGTTIVLA